MYVNVTALLMVILTYVHVSLSKTHSTNVIDVHASSKKKKKMTLE